MLGLRVKEGVDINKLFNEQSWRKKSQKLN